MGKKLAAKTDEDGRLVSSMNIMYFDGHGNMTRRDQLFMPVEIDEKVETREAVTSCPPCEETFSAPKMDYRKTLLDSIEELGW